MNLIILRIWKQNEVIEDSFPRKFLDVPGKTPEWIPKIRDSRFRPKNYHAPVSAAEKERALIVDMRPDCPENDPILSMAREGIPRVAVFGRRDGLLPGFLPEDLTGQIGQRELNIEIPQTFMKVVHRWSRDFDAFHASDGLTPTYVLGAGMEETRAEERLLLFMRLVSLRLVSRATIGSVERNTQSLQDFISTGESASVICDRLRTPSLDIPGVNPHPTTVWSLAALFPDVMHQLCALSERTVDEKVAEEVKRLLLYLVEQLVRFGTHRIIGPLNEWVGDDIAWFGRLSALLGAIGPVRSLGHDDGQFDGLMPWKLSDQSRYDRARAAIDARQVVRYIRSRLENGKNGPPLPLIEEWRTNLNEFDRILNACRFDDRNPARELAAFQILKPRLRGQIVLNDVPLLIDKILKNDPELRNILWTDDSVRSTPASCNTLSEYVQEFHNGERDLTRTPRLVTAGGPLRNFGYCVLKHLANDAVAARTLTEWLSGPMVGARGSQISVLAFKWLLARVLHESHPELHYDEGFRLIVLSMKMSRNPAEGGLDPYFKMLCEESSRSASLRETLKDFAEIVVIAHDGAGASGAYSLSRNQVPPKSLATALQPLIERVDPWHTRYVLATPTFEQHAVPKAP